MEKEELQKFATVGKYYAATRNLLIGSYPILDTGNGYDVMKELTERINQMTPKHKKKIQKLFLSYMFDWEKK